MSPCLGTSESRDCVRGESEAHEESLALPAAYADDPDAQGTLSLLPFEKQQREIRKGSLESSWRLEHRRQLEESSLGILAVARTDSLMYVHLTLGLFDQVPSSSLQNESYRGRLDR